MIVIYIDMDMNIIDILENEGFHNLADIVKNATINL
jgi:hypothetical protein